MSKGKDLQMKPIQGMTPQFLEKEAGNGDEKKPKKMKPKKPDPAELIKMYEERGLNTTEASHKAISDLQSFASELLARLKDESSRPRSSARDKQINNRLSVLEMKIDSKPSMPQSLAIGVTASAIVSAAPSVFNALASTWSSISNSLKRN
eukprot:TRINITY_DN13741_c0_g1_i1.p1 TRINITY_DN13741_c0_g1~~TRINITY_DN13741_c0_g1_i1.p1  ORF type:complete len:150 (-),score=26.67 TRINITY_DN13741_c0_g1_i1:364-813(-)